MKVINLQEEFGSYYDNYRKLYLHPHWLRKRFEILARDDFKCSRCGCDDMPLEIHHDFYEYGLAPWEYDSEYLRTLCIDCHNEQHTRQAA